MYVLFKLPRLKLLDFENVKLREREEAMKFFSSAEGLAVISKLTAETSSIASVGSGRSVTTQATMTEEQKQYVRGLITAAKSLEEVTSIEEQLKDGTFTFPADLATANSVIAHDA
jgi:U2 small nuclear ribonucleoprotein A'